MLTAGIMNGIVIWIQSVIDWIRRIWYAAHGAVIVSADCEKSIVSSRQSNRASEMFRFTYEGAEHHVKVSDVAQRFETLPANEPTDLLWIPGGEKGLLFRYKSDEKSRRILLICDAVSIAGMILMIVGFALVSTVSGRSAANSRTLTVLIEGCVLGGIALMIILGIVRRKLRKQSVT